jgi:spore germination cell wall hydrolase CwlJ-like protein
MAEGLDSPGTDGELLLGHHLRHRPDRAGVSVLDAVLTLIALFCVAVPTLVVLRADRTHPYRDVVALPARVVPRTELPPVEPMKLVDLAPDDARAFNAAQPFSRDPIPPARPFRFAGAADDRARATDCLAAAVIYEAGDDTTGERAVAQVVLNRLRHPAFPKTVCGVVFEGSERATGCQFTFTCDGALTRWHPSEAGWRRARAVAAAALAGSVDGDVGYATHYHTDWVVPYWQASLDKIAAVETHLFFRWSGWWGTPPAFNRQPNPVEPLVAKLAALSPVHAAAGTLAVDGDGATAPGVPFFGRTLKPLANDPDTFLTTLDPAQPPDSYKALAIQACGDRPHCKVLGWTDPSAMAFVLPLAPEAQAALSFSYLRDRASGFDKALWNCAEFKRAPAGSCMKAVVAVARPAAPTADIATSDSVDDLGGVRRRSVPAPASTPVP